MKRNKKFHHAGRIVSFLLVLCMIVCMVPITALADVTDPEDSETITTATSGELTQTTPDNPTPGQTDGNIQVMAAPEGSTELTSVSAWIDGMKTPIAGPYYEDQTLVGAYVADYTCTARWWEAGSTEPINSFVAGKSYVLKVTFTTNNGDTFATDCEATIDGQTYTNGVYDSAANSMTYTMDPVVAVAPTGITEVSADTQFTLPPVAGPVPAQIAATVPSGANYTCTTEWWEAAAGATDLSTTLVEGKRYVIEYKFEIADGSDATFSENCTATIDGKFRSDGLVYGGGKKVLFVSDPYDVAGSTGTKGDANFKVTEGNGATGSVSYRFDNEGAFTGVTNGDKVTIPASAASITIKAVPDGTSKINQANSNIWLNGAKAGTFNFSNLQSETGFTYQLSELSEAGNTLDFIVEFDNNDGTGGGGGRNPGDIQNPTTISVDVTGAEYLDSSGHGATIRIDGFDVQDGSVTVEQAETHVISLMPEFGNEISAEINGNVVNGTPATGEGMLGWMNYTVSHADAYNIVISKTGSSVYTVVWDYVGDFGDDALVSNGTVRIISATLPDGSNGIGIINDQGTEGGHVVIKPGSTVTVEIKPDYGYQFVKGSLNGVEISAEEAVSTFTFVMAEANLHLSALFTEAEDIINTDSTQVQAGSIAGGANVVDSGNLKLEIGDLSQSEIDAVDEEMKQTAGDDEIQLYLNMDLYSVVNKGTQDAAWENQLTDLNGDLSVTLELSEELKGTDGTFYVIREHEETDGSKTYTKIQATYDKAAGTVTFTTNKFSTYALVLEPEADFQQNNSGGGNTGGGNTGGGNTGGGNTGGGNTGGGNIGGGNTGGGNTDGGNADGGNAGGGSTSADNACNAELAELTDDLISKLLTDAEKTRLENGEEVKVWLEATDISTTVSQTDKELIDSKKGNATIGMYLDIDVLKQIGTDSPVNITETNGALTITLKVPSSLINSNASVTRTYQMIRVHNGVATVIPCTYNAANQTLSFETDQFSTYALAYVDQQNDSGGGNTGGGSTDGGSSTDGSNNIKDAVPKTGDTSNAYIWFILAFVSGIGALYFGKKGLVLKKGN